MLGKYKLKKCSKLKSTKHLLSKFSNVSKDTKAKTHTKEGSSFWYVTGLSEKVVLGAYFDNGCVCTWYAT